MELMINFLIVIIAFVSMEAVAWFSHKFIMHGILWNLHKDHHNPQHRKKIETNDSFFLLFALPAVACLILGLENYTASFWVGTGITIYGFAYFFVHDLFIHQRIKILNNVQWKYFKAIRKAHKVHHKHMKKEHGECFGMLWVPLKYLKK